MIRARIDTTRLVYILTLAYVCLTVYFPKLDVGVGGIYPLEIVFVATILMAAASGHVRFTSLAEKSYLAYVLVVQTSFFIGYYYSGEFFLSSEIVLIKHSMFILLIPISRAVRRATDWSTVRLILATQVVFVFAAGSYVVYNMMTEPRDVSTIVWEYSNRYRLVGLTGTKIGRRGMELAGTTSVQMGVYVAFLVLISACLYICRGGTRYLLLFCLLCGAELLTQSRTGLLVVAIGVLYLIKLMPLDKRVHRLVCAVVLPFVLLSVDGSLRNVVTMFGTLGKIMGSAGGVDASIQNRLDYMRRAFQYVKEKPIALLTGTGYGESNTFALIGTPHLESLIPTTLFQSGLLATGLLGAHLYAIWSFAVRGSKVAHGTPYQPVFLAFRLFIPGFFLANCIGGNSLQTDFFAPWFYFLLGICMQIDRTLLSTEQKTET